MNIMNLKDFNTTPLAIQELFEIEGGKDWLTSLGAAAGELWCEAKSI
jgi:hypothetical protein